MRPKEIRPAPMLFWGLLLLGLIAWTYLDPDRFTTRETARIHGRTMGTTYTILVHHPLGSRQFQRLDQAIETRLEQLDQTFSTWREDSTISAFNRLPPHQPFAVSNDFAHVTHAALDLATRSHGAFDPTIKPLVDAWGFGSIGTNQTQRTEAELQTLRQQIGHQHLLFEPQTGTLTKRQANIQLDFAAIAKGFGSDALSALLSQHGYTNHFVEIGGEVRTSGHKTDGSPWRVGITRPQPEANPNDFAALAELRHNRAIATSGNYRNYRRDPEGRLHSHLLDPRLGRPVTSNTLSVSVVAPTCMQADALATALFVLGPEQGLPLLQSLPQTEALFLVHDPATTDILHIATPGFPSLEPTPP